MKLLMTALLLLISAAIFAQSAGPDQNTCLYTVIRTAAIGTGVWSAAAGNPNYVFFNDTTAPATYVGRFDNPGIYKLIWTSAGQNDTMAVTVNNSTIIPGITIAASQPFYCAGSADTFSIIPSNVDSIISYQWFSNWWINGASVSGSPTYIVGLDSVSAIMTCTAACASQPILISGNYATYSAPLPATPVLSMAGTCLGSDSLELRGVAGNQLIEWYQGGVPVHSTPFPTMVVAGGNGSGSAANQLANPTAICKDALGNIYVADANNHRIQKFPSGSTSATNGTTVAGGNGGGNAANQLGNNVSSICLDASGNLYIADVFNNRIQKFPSGSTSATNGITVAGGNGQGSAANQLYVPYFIGLDASGNLYVCDENNARIMKFPAGSTSATNGTIVGGGNGLGLANNQLDGPNGFVVDGSGNVYMSDDSNGVTRIREFPAGSTAATNSTELIVESGYGSIYADASGDLYINNGSTVKKYLAGNITVNSGILIADGYGVGSGSTIYVDASGDLYLGDGANNEIWERQNGATFDSVYTPVAAGQYTATVLGPNGCTSLISDTITIVSCPSDSVWPGDADHNGVADNNDLLPIGTAYGLNGFARASMSIAWQADYCQDWGVQFLNGENTKHADCNGDGTINAADTTAIMANFGLTHSKTYSSTPWRSGVPALSLQLSRDTVYSGDTLITSFVLGDSSFPVSNIAGLAFTYHYDPIVVDTTMVSFSFIPSWLGGATDAISISKNFVSSGILKAAITRIDHTNRSGYGVIGVMYSRITADNINGKDYAYYTNLGFISDITAIDANGDPIQLNAGIDSDQLAYTPTGIHEVPQTININIYPNPANEQIQIVADNVIQDIRISDLLGKDVLFSEGQGKTLHNLSVAGLPDGMYVVRVTTHAGTGDIKLSIYH